jgi:CTP:molybdopterin cytidylyltransferase MocA
MIGPVDKALVLAAGNGDRFRNPTRESKLLQPVLGRPLIIRTSVRSDSISGSVVIV